MSDGINIRFFATLKELAGTSSLCFPTPEPLTIDTLRDQLAQQIPAIAPALPSAIAAINQEYAFAGQVIQPGDEVAFFPPVSGGQAYPEHFALAAEPIDLNDLTQRIVTPDTGAVALFSGFVRGQTQTGEGQRETVRLEYEAYEPMALAKMQQVAAEIREKWSLVQGIGMVQRIGVLQVGEPTVIIACAAGHRDQGCFEAARYGIDRLKEIVPVWKKEVSPTAQSQWIEGHYHPTPEDRQTGT